MTDESTPNKQPEEPALPSSTADGSHESRPLSERPAARPIRQGGNSADYTVDRKASAEHPETPRKDERFLLGIGCLGWFAIMIGIAVVILVIAGLSGGMKPPSRIQACYDAQNARSISNSSSNEHDRQIAAMQYAVKKAECESQGGAVP